MLRTHVIFSSFAHRRTCALPSAVLTSACVSLGSTSIEVLPALRQLSCPLHTRANDSHRTLEELTRPQRPIRHLAAPHRTVHRTPEERLAATYKPNRRNALALDAPHIAPHAWAHHQSMPSFL